MNTHLQTVDRRRTHNRKAAARETLRLRVYTRIEREIGRRKRLGQFGEIGRVNEVLIDTEVPELVAA